MKTIGFALNNLYLIIAPFNYSRVIRKTAVVYNTVAREWFNVQQWLNQASISCKEYVVLNLYLSVKLVIIRRSFNSLSRSNNKGVAIIKQKVRQGYRAGGRAPYGYKLATISRE